MRRPFRVPRGPQRRAAARPGPRRVRGRTLAGGTGGVVLATVFIFFFPGDLKMEFFCFFLFSGGLKQMEVPLFEK